MTITRRVFVQSAGAALWSLALRPAGRPMLVCVFLRGAVDGLSMIVPHGEPLYYRERPRIAIPARDVVNLDGQFGLHPSLAPLKPLWDNKSLTALHGVGVSGVLRSHMDAQRRLNGWLRQRGAVAFGSLREIARRIKARTAPPVTVTHTDGWDTHFNQGSSEGQLATRLRELGLGLAAFSRDLGERMRSVVVLTISEFGRTIAENTNGGTDHGHGTAMLVLGGPVNGGKVLGKWAGPVTTEYRELFGQTIRS